jgi:acetyl-CoA acetyltransferase
VAKTRNAVILGGGTSKFGVRQATMFDMIQEAAKACADDIPGLKPADIDGLIFASTMAGRHANALNTAPLVAHRLGIKPTSICVRIDPVFGFQYQGMTWADRKRYCRSGSGTVRIYALRWKPLHN